ncbi:MAG: AAA family ATPase, partial [Oscillospiraceae bacterium]|nr:AAA family ATPase [Oscillospiraceae bacterium]
MSSPLADKIRPKKIEDVVGQRHLLEKNKPLRKIIESGTIPNMIFFGPSGTGKTTVARIIAERTNKSLHKLNGTSATTDDIRNIIAEINTFSGCDGILLYLDEIQYLNKKQQLAFLQQAARDLANSRPTAANRYGQITFRAAVRAEKALE